jgi:hypothetical protein
VLNVPGTNGLFTYEATGIVRAGGESRMARRNAGTRLALARSEPARGIKVTLEVTLLVNTLPAHPANITS